jgi:hypothetical protein
VHLFVLVTISNCRVHGYGHLKKFWMIVLKVVASRCCHVVMWLRRNVRNSGHCLIKVLVNEAAFSNSCTVTVTQCACHHRFLWSVRYDPRREQPAPVSDTILWTKTPSVIKVRQVTKSGVKKYGHLVSTWLAIISHSDYASCLLKLTAVALNHLWHRGNGEPRPNKR